MRRLLLAVVLCLLGFPALADQVILTDGRIIDADSVEVDRARDVVVIKRGQATFSFPMHKVARIVGGSSKTGAGPTKPNPLGGPAQAVLIPLQGSIDYLRTEEDLRQILARARKLKPKLIVFEIGSPGGRVDVARKLAVLLLELRDIKTVAWIHGQDRGAYSAAAYLSICCQKIYMAPGHSIGAAVAYRPGKDGLPEAVSAKFNSAWRADFRAAAETNDHPIAVVQAMVDDRVGLAEVKIKGRRRFVAARSLKRLEARARRKKVSFQRLRVVCRPGQVLTLTSKEAVSVRLSSGVAQDLAGILLLHGVNQKQVKRLPDPLKLAQRAVQRGQKVLDREVKRLAKIYAKIQAEDPRQYTYSIDTATRVFKDGGKEWRRRTSKCLAAIKKSLKKLDDIRKQGARNPDLDVSPTTVDKLESDLRGYSAKLKSEKWAKKLPIR